MAMAISDGLLEYVNDWISETNCIYHPLILG